MLMKRNLLESVTIISCSCTLLCFIFNYATNISPVTGYWFVAYTIFLFIASIILSVKIIQWLLHLNKPIKYDLESVIDKYPYSAFLVKTLPLIPKKTKSLECKEYDTNELSVITSVLEKRLVSSWYIHYISQEISFPFACKQMLDQMISKAFQICNNIETIDVYVDVCAILISHLKEFKKALKRHEKSSEKSIESLYKKVHQISEHKDEAAVADHCVNIIRLVLKELVSWELWDTPHSELIIRILAKKLDTYVECTISNPVWLNDKILSILTSQKDVPEKQTKPNTNIDEEGLTSLQEGEIYLPTVNQLGTKDNSDITLNKENLKNIEENDKCFEAKETITYTEPVEIKPVLRQRRGRQGKNEVKIYDRVIEGSVKTWETDVDLQCISMGQDLLESLDEMTLSRLWGHEDLETSPNMRGNSPQPLWFGEEDAIELEPEPAKETKSSPKAADALLKDIQSTVNQAKSKIGDLQVPLHVDKPTGDEAAGMMEGLLDKGIAGIRKGLRFTGLSDDSQEKSPSHQREKPSPTERRDRLEVVAEHRDIKEHVPKDDNTVPQLVKQQRVTSQDSSQVEAHEREASLPSSPEPQYEEAADLSHSIAKLRSLLSEAAPRNGDVWWEAAEETRGRTQAHHSDRRVDSATLADEYDMNLERNASPSQTSNNMQRLDRLFQRTVTGVFNSIKTAVGSEAEGEPNCRGQWTYVTTDVDTTVGNAVSRLVGSRRALAHVDSALDSLQQLPTQAHVEDDLEEWPRKSRVWSAACEVLCELRLLEDHVSFRLATLLLADVAETLICSWLEELTAWLRKEVFATFERMAESETEPQSPETLRQLDIDETCRIVLDKIPETYIFGQETLHQAVRLLVSSFSHEAINRDVVYRTIDLLTQHFINAAAFRNSSFDSN